MIEVNNCSKRYDRQTVLSRIDFRVTGGEFLGIIGPNGSGKTTLLKLLSGEEHADEGDIFLLGRRVERWGIRERAKILTAVAQEGLPPVAFTVYDVVMMGRHVYQTRFQRPSGEDHRIVERVLRATGLTGLAHKPTAKLSGGERQRVAIARAMAQEPQVLLLDEPTTYLDIGYQLQVLEYVKEWQRQTGAVVVAVLHDLNLAAQFCDRIVLLHRGRIVASGSPGEVLQADILHKVYETRPHIIPHPHLGVPQVLLGRAAVRS